ncbi:MAG: hypothetical protein IBV52_03980 [Candidatus Bathyarchaeota archaeon]
MGDEVVVLDKKSFILPYVERGKFSRLLRLGLEYNRDKGTYSINNFGKIEELVDTISSILNDEVLFLQNCLMCSKDFACSDCKYADFCATKNLPFQCVCPQCLKEGKTHQQKHSETSDGD